MKNNNLKNILSSWLTLQNEYQITGIESDSRLIKSGNLFCKLNDNINNEYKYIVNAINNGASIILCNTKIKRQHGMLKNTINHVPIIYFFNLPKIFPNILQKYFYIKNKLIIIGVTGTNGKSTTTHIIAQWMNLLGKNTGIMGTLGHGIYNNLKITKNTTESLVSIRKFLFNISNKKIKHVVMEVSSHSIVQKRILGIQFNIAIITNITPDHLDYHKNMNNYICSKWSFISNNNIKTCIINADDKIISTWIEKLLFKNIIIISTNKNFNYSLYKKWIVATKITDSNNYANINFNSSWGTGLLKSKLIGKFNITNLLLALATLLELGHPITHLINTCKYIKTIPGRMEQFNFHNKPTVIVDYAHNSDALKNLLTTLRKKFNKINKLWCIFGCGGNRDYKKRFNMGRIAEKISDEVILTNDNPRYENELKIVQDIIKGCFNKDKIHIILNRKHAIKFAIQHSNKNDLIVISGKGHEKYQIIGNNSYYFSDQETIKQLLK